MTETLEGITMLTQHFPIEASKAEIMEAIMANPVTVVQGETGSGKSTHIPMYLFEIPGITDRGQIGVTEPRRIAATSLAKYVASLMGVNPGEEVGHQIRFDAYVGNKTMVKYMTDGILLREIQDDPMLSKYSAIVIDEAHERSLNIDFLLGLIKRVLKKRHDLKVVITSATIDTAKFSAFFDGAPVVSVSGRCFPVDIVYRPFEMPWDPFKMTEAIAEAAANEVRDIHLLQPEGDVLVFMSGMDDILATVEKLEAMKLVDVEILLAHGDMTFEDQQKIMDDYPGKRKVVIGTNILETGITVDGVRFVVDSGYIKQSGYDAERGMTSLRRVEHSKAGCDQRAGRGGRTQAGLCIRLFSEVGYQNRPDYTKPEILRTELAELVLSMKSIGIHDIEGFDFVDSPAVEAIHAAHVTLTKLGAIAPGNGLTDIGRRLAKLPLEPQSGRMIIAAEAFGCVDEVLTVVAFRSLGQVFARPRDKQAEADKAKNRFRVAGSDYLTSLRVYTEYLASGKSASWARQNFLKSKVLYEVGEIRKQLTKLLKQSGVTISSNNDPVAIAKCVASGLVENVCKKQGWMGHRYLSGDNEVYIFPGSTLFHDDPEWFVANQLRHNGNKTYGIDCQAIKPEWLYEIAPQLCTSVIDQENIAFEAETKIFRAKRTVSFDGVGDICTVETICWAGSPEYEDLKKLYARNLAWDAFVGVNPEQEFYPRSLDDFEIDDIQVVVEVDEDPTHPSVEIAAFPYIRIDYHIGGESRYYRGYTRHQVKANHDTGHARSMWRIKNSRSGIYNY